MGNEASSSEKDQYPASSDQRVVVDGSKHSVAQGGASGAAAAPLPEGARPVDALGNTPLHLAARAGDEAAVARYIAAGVPVDVKNASGATPLTQAKSLRIVQQLLAAGASVNAGNKYGNTALHAACGQGNIQLAQFLIQNGANVNVHNGEGWSPMDCALHWEFNTDTPNGGQRAIAGMLRRGGAISYHFEPDSATLRKSEVHPMPSAPADVVLKQPMIPNDPVGAALYGVPVAEPVPSAPDLPAGPAAGGAADEAPPAYTDSPTVDAGRLWEVALARFKAASTPDAVLVALKQLRVIVDGNPSLLTVENKRALIEVGFERRRTHAAIWTAELAKAFGDSLVPFRQIDMS